MSEALDAFRRGDLDRARSLAETAVAAEPSAQWQHLLGLIHCRRGDPSTGVDWLNRACEADPANIGFQVIAARALVDAGRPADVLAMAEPPPPTASTACLALWQARGEAADAAGDDHASERAWRTVATATPADWRAWANLGNALARLDQWSAAADALGQSVALNPTEQPLRKRYASALTHAGFHEKSAEQLRRVLALQPGDAEARLTLARIYVDLGRDSDAVDQLDEARRALGGTEDEGLVRALLHRSDNESIGDREISAVRELALLLERTNRIPGLRSLLAQARKRGIDPQRIGYAASLCALHDGDPARAKELLLGEDSGLDPVRWHSLMARIEEALGNSARAFAAAEAMHLAVPDYGSWRRKAAGYRGKIERFAATVDPEWVEKLTPLGPASRRAPVFLVGFPRSGTTLLDTFLRGHPNARVIEEQHMLNAAETVIGDFAELPARSTDELERAREAYFAELDRHIEPGFDGVVIDKLPLNMLGLPIVYSLFPDARIIFAQRHPCDVVLSCFFQAFSQNDAMACFLDLGDAAALYDVSMRLFSKSRELLPLEFHTSPYENLIADPEATLRPTLEFVGLDWRPELLDHQATAKARGVINTPSYSQVAKPLTQAPAGRWRRYRDQLSPVLPLLLSWAERLGYSA